MTRSRFALAAALLVAVVVVIVVLAGRSAQPLASPSPSRSPSPTVAASVSPTATTTSSPAAASPSPASGAVLTASFGPLVAVHDIYNAPGGTFRIRSETDARTITEFSGYIPAVSVDGRRLAYWRSASQNTPPFALIVREVGGAERTIVTLPDRRGGRIVWSNDGNGLLYEHRAVSVTGTPPPPPPPDSSQLVAYDLVAAQGTSLARPNAFSDMLPVAWDRPASLVGAVLTGDGGFTREYAIWDMRQPAVAPRVTTLPAAFIAHTVTASSDAKFVLASEVGLANVRWWPASDGAAAQQLQVEAGRRAVTWRPGTSQLAWISGTGELTLYDVRTGARTVAARSQDLQGSTIIAFRPDGSVAITAAQIAYELRVVEVATGRSAPLIIEGIVVTGWVRLN